MPGAQHDAGGTAGSRAATKDAGAESEEQRFILVARCASLRRYRA